MAIEVTLTQSEVLMSVVAGGLRSERARRTGQKSTFFPNEGMTVCFDIDIGSAAAEIAAARVLLCYPLGLSGEKLPDLVGRDGFWEVRHTEKGSHLIIRGRDLGEPGEPDVRYVLVTGSYNTFTIHGWAWRSDVVTSVYEKKKSNPKDDEQYWWMPAKDLRPIEDAVISEEKR